MKPQKTLASGNGYSIIMIEQTYKDNIETIPRRILMSCGRNGYGQLGHGDSYHRDKFETIQGISLR